VAERELENVSRRKRYPQSLIPIPREGKNNLRVIDPKQLTELGQRINE
tara:strand:+ start:573 stop:716 length:144 start_codon:yes stop_codon:yes gene_type:complete